MADMKPDEARVAKLKPLIDEVQKAYWARGQAEKIYDEAERALRRAVGPGHVFTNEMCRVNKIGGHIYNNDHSYAGVGHRNCILCGTDDWDM